MPEPVAEYQPIPGRRWRLDYAWPRERVGLEIDGGLFAGGRHGGARSVARDLEKRNTLTAARWHVIHVAPSQLWQETTWQWLGALLMREDR